MIIIADFEELLTEQANPNTFSIDLLSTQDMLRLINEEDKKVAFAVENEIPNIAIAIDSIAAKIAVGGRLIYIGAGTSGRLGVLDAAECPPTFSVESGLVVGLIAGGEKALVQAVEGAEDNEQEVISQLTALKLSNKDAVVGIAASGRTPYVISGFRYARSLGAFTVALSCVPDSEVAKVAELAITPLVGPEVITGSTRLKAGTATKLVLNMLSTGVMVKQGKVYGNLMVDVRPTNVKLLERAVRIVSEAADTSRKKAAETLEAAGYNPKMAIVMLKRNCSAVEASVYLDEAGGFIRQAINVKTKENTK